MADNKQKIVAAVLAMPTVELLELVREVRAAINDVPASCGEDPTEWTDAEWTCYFAQMAEGEPV